MHDTRLMADAMAHAPLLSALSPAWIDRLATASRLARLRGGIQLRRQGEIPTHVMLVITGRLAYSRSQPNGRRHIVRYHGAGEIGDIIPAVDGGGCVFDVVTHGDTSLALTPCAELRGAMQEEPAFLFEVARLLCQRSRLSYELVEQQASGTLQQRLGLSLLELVDRCGVHTPEGIEIAMKLPQEDLADLLSASRQRTNAELRRLVREGVISTRYGRITVRDRTRLAELSGGSADASPPCRILVA